MKKNTYNNKLTNIIESFKERAITTLERGNLTGSVYLAHLGSMWAHTLNHGETYPNPFKDYKDPVLARWFRFGVEASSEAVNQNDKLSEKFKAYEKNWSKDKKKKFLGIFG